MLALAVAGSALAFGGQHTSVLVVSALAAAGAALLLHPARAPRGTWVFVGLAGYSLLQIVPLPLGLIEHLSPAAAAVWRGAFSPFGEGAPPLGTLSVDPGATALEVLKWSAYSCVLVAAAGARVRWRSVALALLVFGSALLVCVVTLVHGALNLEHIYGFFRPTDTSRWVRGPFVNGNNLSGFLNLGVFAGAGVALSKRAGRFTPSVGAGVVILGAGSLLASSRAGTISLLLGGVLLVAFLLRQRRVAPSRVALVGGVLGLASFALAVSVSGQRVFSTLLDTQVKVKLSAWRWTLDLVRAFPIFGAGRGAFDAAFQPYRQPLGTDWLNVYVHAENFPLEWAAGWGVPVTLVALGASALFARRALRRAAGDPVAAGLVVGVAMLALQNLADLGFEVFAMMAAMVVALAGADEPPVAGAPAGSVRIPPVAVVAAAALALVLGAAVPQVARQRAARTYAGLAHAGREGLLAFRGELRRAIRLHPGDAYLPLLGGLTAERLHQDPLPWLGRALERSPLDGNAHLALSDVLARHKAIPQSLMHARFAALYAGELREQAMQRIVVRVRNEADLLAAFPEGLPGAELLPAACGKIRPELKVSCWREAVRRQAVPETEQALAVALLDALAAAAAPCSATARADCQAEALALLDRIEAQGGGVDWEVSHLKAKLAALAGDSGKAALLLLERCPGSGDAITCYGRALEFAAGGKDPATLEAVAKPYAAAACGEPSVCGALHEHVGRLLMTMDARQLALRHFLDAAKASPSLERWLLTAETAAGLESRVTAQLALDRARREPGVGPADQRRMEAVVALLEGARAD